MHFEFYKYQGTGNDFVMIDGRKGNPNFTENQISEICDRRFGIGADGLIVLLPHPELDFEMDYYNADGSKSFCGNGSRCAQAFAQKLGIIHEQSQFLAIDGVHDGLIRDGLYATKMGDVTSSRIEEIGVDWFIHTGSPHYIVFTKNLDGLNVFEEGRKIRYSDPYKNEGVNVNFVEQINDGIRVRTYERGVENETLSCGTGVTAAAIAYVLKNSLDQKEVKVHTKGGELAIKLAQAENRNFEEIWLIGPAKEVYQGKYFL